MRADSQFAIVSYAFSSIFLLGILIAAIVYTISKDNYDSNIVEHKTSRSNGSFTRIDEITVDSITHQYIVYHGSMCHFPECKYCKKGN